ncbi:MAG: diguanylate cyclase [Planctomycetes bacterium]|nr:diguanylate cyclase [Planctomycetota bacterium]
MSERTEAVLVIGSPALRESVCHAVPVERVQHVGPLLEGVWTSGQRAFGTILVQARNGRTPAAIKALRRAAPGSRIIVTCAPVDEPLGRRLVEDGADHYLLEPLDPEELRSVLRGAPAGGECARRPDPPAVDEIASIADAIGAVGDKPARILEHLAALIQGSLAAPGITIKTEQGTFSNCEPHEIVLEQAIMRDRRAIGRIGLARRNSGPYTSSAVERLSGFARLAEELLRASAACNGWRDLASSDALTGLPNARAFEGALDRLLQQAMAERLRITVLRLRLANLDAYNGAHGRSAGDGLIRELAGLLRGCTRAADLVARIDGGEFAVVLWDAESRRVRDSEHPREAESFLQRFGSIAAEHEFRRLGPSAAGPAILRAGLASFPWTAATREALMAAADSRSGDAGGSCPTLFIAGAAEASVLTNRTQA